MTAIILAAGMGSRLAPITETRPKCLVRVAGKPILQHQIEAYRGAGVDKVVVVCGYLGHKIREFVARYGKFVECIDNEDYEITNNMYSFHLALEKVREGELLLSNADVVFDPSIVQEFVKVSGSGIAVDKGTYFEESMKLKVDSNGVHGISKGFVREESYGNSIDVYKFEGDFLETLRAHVEKAIVSNPKDWTEVAIHEVLQTRVDDVKPFNIHGRKWVEVDNYTDLQVADDLFASYDPSFNAMYFVDLDGTLFLGEQVIEGAAEFVTKLQSDGSPFMLLTNNSSKSKSQYVASLADMGIDVSEGQIILSSDAAIAYLSSLGFQNVFVLGTEALKASVRDAGFVVEADDYECVLVGYDTELTYEKLREASLLIQNGVMYIATHKDVVCPTPDGNIPDIGAMTEMLESVTGRQPDKVFGKPDKEMVQFLLEKRGLDGKQVTFIGDRVYTDMQMARNVGAQFILVLSGETKREVVDALDDFPERIVQSVASLT